MATYPTEFNKEELLKCSRGELFGPGNAQLPAPPMLMIDRITEISEDSGPRKGHVVAEFNITPDLWFLSAISRQSNYARLLRLGCIMAIDRF